MGHSFLGRGRELFRVARVEDHCHEDRTCVPVRQAGLSQLEGHLSRRHAGFLPVQGLDDVSFGDVLTFSGPS